ncbi:MAG: DUF4838 domain-containing protein [Verrucomicrobia bacterium]|nr:DUF4838 domain-containing protein [Verrucomicrobiota bacterium]
MKTHSAATIMVPVALLFGNLPTSAPGSLTLVENGQPRSSVVIAKQATRAARLAAFDLQYHVQKITGATLPIEEVPSAEGRVTSGKTANGPIRILVGESQATVDLGLKSADFKPQEYLVKFLPETLVLMGRDKDDRGEMNYATGAGFPDIADEQGTCYAVYDFLERYCGVRWYLPTDLGITFTPTKTLTVAGADLRRAPAMKYRYNHMGYAYPLDLAGDTVRGKEPIPALPRREHHLFYCRNRLGGENHAANHSFYGFYDRFWQKNPKNEAVFEGEHRDWFAQGYPADEKPSQMCFANEGFIKQVVQDARDYFDGKGKKHAAVAEGDDFALVPMDSGNWCKCAACQAELLKEATQGKGQFSTNLASDYIFGFINKVAREIKKSHPTKYVSTLAYWDYAYPPTRVKLEPNIKLEMCLHTRAWGYSQKIKENDLALFKQWTEHKDHPPLYLWLYYCFPSLGAAQGQWRTFPGFFAHHIVEQMKRFHQAGIRGLKYEPSYLADERQSPLLDQLEFHVTWKLADDPTLDGNALIAEFFKRYYGPAAEPMRKFYTRAEQIYNDPANYPDNRGVNAETCWKYLGTKERMAELGRLMAAAQQAVAAGTAVEKERVALFERGLWKYMQAGSEDYWTKAKIPSPTARAPRAPAPPDGDPSKLDWSKGAVLSGWRSITGEPASRKIEGRLLHDGLNLYLRLEDFISPDKLVDRGGLWNSDEYELFVAGQRSPPYRQMGIHFNGKYEALDWAKQGRQEWNNPGRVISDLNAPDRWTLYVVLPLAGLTETGVKPGDTCYLNIIRSMRIQPQEAFVWNLTLGGYHEPSRFAEVILEK